MVSALGGEFEAVHLADLAYSADQLRLARAPGRREVSQHPPPNLLPGRRGVTAFAAFDAGLRRVGRRRLRNSWPGLASAQQLFNLVE